MTTAQATLDLLATWDAQSGRIAESMGIDNPRFQSVDQAVEALRKAVMDEVKLVPIGDTFPELRAQWAERH